MLQNARTAFGGYFKEGNEFCFWGVQSGYSLYMGRCGSPHGGEAARTEDPKIPETLGFPRVWNGDQAGIQSSCTLIQGKEGLLQVLCVCVCVSISLCLCVFSGREKESEKIELTHSWFSH